MESECGTAPTFRGVSIGEASFNQFCNSSTSAHDPLLIWPLLVGSLRSSINPCFFNVGSSLVTVESSGLAVDRIAALPLQENSGAGGAVAGFPSPADDSVVGEGEELRSSSGEGCSLSLLLSRSLVLIEASRNACDVFSLCCVVGSG